MATFTFGKYNGQTIEQVFTSGKEGISYLEWALGNLYSAPIYKAIAGFMMAAHTARYIESREMGREIVKHNLSQAFEGKGWDAEKVQRNLDKFAPMFEARLDAQPTDPQVVAWQMVDEIIAALANAK